MASLFVLKKHFQSVSVYLIFAGAVLSGRENNAKEYSEQNVINDRTLRVFNTFGVWIFFFFLY